MRPLTLIVGAQAGDMESANRMKIIHNDEITHVARGKNGFAICMICGFGSIQSMVRKQFIGLLKPSFNEEDR